MTTISKNGIKSKIVKFDNPDVSDVVLRKIRFRGVTDEGVMVEKGTLVYGYPFIYPGGDFYLKDSTLKVTTEAHYTDEYGYDWGVSELFEEYGLDPDDFHYDFDNNPPEAFVATLPEDYENDDDEEMTFRLSQVKGEKYHKVFEYHVDRNSVQQFTGLRDKHKVEIYEGDIIHVGFPTCRYEVVWHDAGFKAKKAGDGIIIDFVPLLKDVEVLGNIHQNPELMELKNYKNK